MASDSDHDLANLQPRTGKVIMYPDGSTTFIEWASDSDSDEDGVADEDDDSHEEEDKADSSNPAPVSPACSTEDTAATTCQSNCCMRRLEFFTLWVSDSVDTPDDDDENKDETDDDTDRQETILSAQARCQQIVSCTDKFCAVKI